MQRRDAPDPPTYVGKGKAEELREVALEIDCDTVVFDDELTPAQQFNLEKLLGRTAIDRTAVILDIFAQNAHSQEGKAQVELALLRYRLPRLRGKGARAVASRPAACRRGGARIGTRGPGETQLEVDRRRIQRRIHKLEAELEDIDQHRDTQRKARRRSRLAAASPSSATRTPASRRCSTGSPTPACSSRTASSPRSTPPPAASTCPAASRAAHRHRRLRPQAAPPARRGVQVDARVVAEADLLVHVVDASAADPDGNIDAVREVLREIGADDVPELLAFNKADLAAGEAKRLADGAPRARSRSRRRTGEGIDEPAAHGRRPPAGAHRRRRAARPLRPGRRPRRGPPRGRGARRGARRRRHARSGPGSTTPLGRFVEFVVVT